MILFEDIKTVIESVSKTNCEYIGEYTVTMSTDLQSIKVDNTSLEKNQ